MKLNLIKVALIIFSLQFLSIDLYSQQNSKQYDEDFLQSLPESVRNDVEIELEESEKDNERTNYRRPSSELSKLELVKKWERFLELEEQEKNKSQRFGLSIFRTMQTSFMPINEPNFDGSYIVDFGDVFSINVTGEKNKEYTSDVKRDGSIFVENVGKIFVSGLTLSEANKVIVSKFKTAIIGDDIFVTLSEIRDIQILITGDSFAPGLYTLNGNTNILHALSMSGGIKDSGSLRSISIKRNGNTINNFDAYDALLYGEVDFKSKLQSGDSILVESVKNLVRISGGVKRPSLFEMTNEETLLDLIDFANGFSSNKSSDEFLYTYQRDNEIIQELVTLDQLKNIIPVDGSTLFVPEIEKSFVEIEGEVKNPGIYPISTNDTIYSLVKRAGGYTKNSYPFGGILLNERASILEQQSANEAYRNFIKLLAQTAISATSAQSTPVNGVNDIAELYRQYKDSEFMGRIQAEFDLTLISSEPRRDTSLSDGDKIIIPKFTDQVYVFGEVFSSGAKRYDDKLSYKDYIVDFSGGYTPTADKGSTYIISPDGSASLVSKFGFSLIDSANEIYPGSIIYVAPKGVLGTQALNQQLQAVSTLALTLASLKSFSD